MKVWQ